MKFRAFVCLSICAAVARPADKPTVSEGLASERLASEDSKTFIKEDSKTFIKEDSTPPVTEHSTPLATKHRTPLVKRNSTPPVTEYIPTLTFEPAFEKFVNLKTINLFVNTNKTVVDLLENSTVQSEAKKVREFILMSLYGYLRTEERDMLEEVNWLSHSTMGRIFEDFLNDFPQSLKFHLIEFSVFPVDLMNSVLPLLGTTMLSLAGSSGITCSVLELLDLPKLFSLDISGLRLLSFPCLKCFANLNHLWASGNYIAYFTAAAYREGKDWYTEIPSLSYMETDLSSLHVIDLNLSKVFTRSDAVLALTVPVTMDDGTIIHEASKPIMFRADLLEASAEAAGLQVITTGEDDEDVPDR